MKRNILFYIAIFALIISIVSIGTIFFKSDISFNFIETFIGILGSIAGVLLSVGFSFIVRKRAKAKIFIAYSYNDYEIAQKLIAILNKNNFNVFTPDEVGKLGEPTAELIRQAIQEVSIVIIVISKNFFKSKSIKNIINDSKSMHKKILPVLIEETEIPNQLSNFQYIDTTKDFEKAADDLITKLLSSR